MLKTKYYSILLVLFLYFNNTFAQLDTIWTKVLGGTQNEANGLTLPNNLGSPGGSISKFGNFLYAVSSSLSNDGDLLLNYGNEDIWVIKLNHNGDTLWTKSFGGSDFERAYKILAFSDGCLIVGSTKSNSNDFTNSKGSSDGFLLRLDENGNIIWFKRYGGTEADYLYDVIPTSDGNFLAVGESLSSNGDLAGTGMGLSWIIKVNPNNGNRIWSKTYLGPDSNSQDYLDNFFRVMELSDGSGIIAAGFTSPNFNDAASDDIHYEKIDLNGNVIWSKKVGSTNGGDAIGNIVDAGNGKFYLIGRLIGTGPNVSNYYGGNGDVWIIKCDAQGNPLWNKNYGGSNWDFAFDAKKDSLNNLYIGAFTRSTDFDAVGVNFGLQDYWLLKTDSSGNILWKYRCGGSQSEIILGIEVLNNNSVVALGRSFSNDGYLKFNNGGSDLWIVRIDSIDVTTHFTQNELPLTKISFFPLENHTYSVTCHENIISIQIFDLQGKSVFQNSSNIETSNTTFPFYQNSGLYVAVIQTVKGSYIYKFYHYGN